MMFFVEAMAGPRGKPPPELKWIVLAVLIGASTLIWWTGCRLKRVWVAITVNFRISTGFGQRIAFIPRVRWFLSWRPHPIAAELRALVAGAQRR